jgi:hypothetical protein
MERNVAYVKRNPELHRGARTLTERTLDKARSLVGAQPTTRTERGGRKAHQMQVMEIE